MKVVASRMEMVQEKMFFLSPYTCTASIKFVSDIIFKHGDYQ